MAITAAAALEELINNPAKFVSYIPKFSQLLELIKRHSDYCNNNKFYCYNKNHER